MTENHPENGPTSRLGRENPSNLYPSGPQPVPSPQNGAGRADPVDALAKVLWDRWQNPEPGIPGVLINDDPRTVAQAVLASGVVVAADKVRALADEWQRQSAEATADSAEDAGYFEALADCAAELLGVEGTSKLAANSAADPHGPCSAENGHEGSCAEASTRALAEKLTKAGLMLAVPLPEGEQR